MAEGRWLPWKEQKADVRPTPDYKELLKPLKKPPHGLEWRRLEDGAWELRRTRKALALLEQDEEENRKREQEARDQKDGKGAGPAGLGEEKEPVPEFLEHVVMPDDTLAGICLKYKVKDRELRRLNGFVGSHFRMCDSLIIPNRFAAGQQPIQGVVVKPPMTRDEKMQIFRKASRLGPQETRFYLEANDWKLAGALSQWRAEIRWEAEQVKAQEQIPISMERKKTTQRRQTFTLRRRLPGAINSGKRGSEVAVPGTTTTAPATSSGRSPAIGGTGNNNNNNNNSIELSKLEEYRVPLLLSDSYGSMSSVTSF